MVRTSFDNRIVADFDPVFQVLEPRLLLSSTWYVDDVIDPLADGSSLHPYGTIQRGIDAAVTGDTVIVRPGAYSEQLHTNGKSFTLRSEDPLNPVTVDATTIGDNSLYTLLTMTGAETNRMVISGLTFRNAMQAIFGYGAQACIDHCAFTNLSDMGIVNADGTIASNRFDHIGLTMSDPTISGCDGTVQDNTITLCGSAIKNCQGLIQRNTITNCGYGLATSNGTIQYNTITGTDSGNPIDNCDGTIQYNTVSNTNNVGSSGGVAMCDGVIRGNIFSNNITTGDALAVWKCNATFEGNYFYNNAISTATTTATYRNCVFAGNLSTPMIDAYGGNVDFFNCTIVNPTKAIDARNYATLDFTNCIIQGTISRAAGSTLTYRYCVIPGCGGSGAGWVAALGTDRTGNKDATPGFVNQYNPAGADGRYLTLDDGLRLSATSAAVDAADGASLPAADCLGAVRWDDPSVANTGTGTPAYGDIGAYERFTNAIMDRRTYYNDSVLDGLTTTITVDDSKAIAWDKTALTPGNTVSSANFTCYSKGINGITIDVVGVPATTTLVATDFIFHVGNTSSSIGWGDAPAPTNIVIRRGEGIVGSDRIMITWADNAIANKWLSVTLKGGTRTGLAANDTFAFGNLPGDFNGDRVVNFTDYLKLEQNFGCAGNAGTGDATCDGLVNFTDYLTLETNFNTSLAAPSLAALALPPQGGANLATQAAPTTVDALALASATPSVVAAQATVVPATQQTAASTSKPAHATRRPGPAGDKQTPSIATPLVEDLLATPA